MEEYKRLMEPYTGSFNFFLNEGLKLIVKHLEPTFYESEGSKVSIKFDEIQIGNPMSYKTLNHRMYPTDARQSHSSYASPMHGWLLVTYGEREPERIQVNLGTIPMMVGSSKCNLYNATPKELIAHHEEEWEVGGFFIVNGVERCLRMVQVARAGHPFAFIRESYTRKMTGYSEFACQVRCVRPDKETKINTLHYVTDGNITLRFMLRGKEFYIPVGLLLKGFYDCTDRQIYETMIQGDYENTFLTDRVELMLAANRDYSVTTRKQALHRLGKLFTRETVFPFADPDMTTEERGEYLIRNYIFPHLDAGQDKFELLVFMIQKLLALVSGRIVADNVDAPSAHEILTPGNLFMVLLKERLRVWMHSIIIGIRIRLSKPKSGKFDDKMLRTCIHDKASTVGQALNYFVATGNIKMEEAFEAPQTSGFSIVAERLNKLRYMAHFRAVHRGAFFAEMKTTTPRKLRPESWGFYCCVHTPDGAPCGLLNHLTALCNVVKEQQLLPARLESLLNTMGMASIGQGSIFPPRYLVVMVNGRVYGRVAPELADSLVKSLRVLKLDQSDPAVPSTLEVVYVPPSITTLYPGIFIYTASARVIRPVLHLASGKTELIGIMEQQFLDIAATDVDIRPETTHKELHPTNILSVVASLTPFSEFNQSPRNMYQCQMGKQSMGTPYHAHPYRTDNKVFKIQHPQKALVRTHAQDKYNMDDYPNGCNAVVAVITYTGYDMEDAMIINKSSYERGFGHGTVYSTKFYDITPTVTKDTHRCYFKKHPTASPDYIDENGLPEVGTKLEKDDVFLQYVTEPQMDFNKEKHKSREPAYIDRVTVIGGTDESEKNRVQHVSVRLRYNRNPIVGDKFSSRHGQKGVLSKLWPEIDMPFSESGMKPDCIINPHAFPSRMTIGMLIESMAGKSGALHGYFPDATPFQFDEKNTAVECFGETLAKAGFNYYGNEPMYSGTTGEIFHADIYLGLVYYQRLRHMVNDKYQARATGQVNRVTQQPIKGRKVGGGIRFGEMERDSLIAHGTSALLLDRLMECSDYSRTYACKNCGSIVSTKSQTDDNGNNVVKCTTCDSAEDIAVIALPFIYRVLTNELAAVNIKISLEIK